MSTEHRIIIADSRSMEELHDGSVQLVITSPPYWQLKDYGNKDQIGFDDTYEKYINNLNLVWQEVFRVLHDGCRLCINIGDQFARAAYYGRYKVMPIRSEIIRFCETIGFDYMGAIIWQKQTTMNTTGGGSVMGSYPHPRNGIIKIDYEFILLFKKPGSAPAATAAQKKQAALTPGEWNTYFKGHWQFPGVKQHRHLAVFPQELPLRLIRMFSFPGETVLDPFVGSGTTSQVAESLKRRSIGYEINSAFIDLIREKFQGNSTVLTVEKREAGKGKSNISHDRLPYLFHDPVKLDKQVNVKHRKYGSRIDRVPAEKKKYSHVKEVCSATEIVLKNGDPVCLLGIKAIPGKESEAMEYISKKLLKKRIYMQYDPAYDYSQCYLFLEDRTFINASLIRKGLADVDTSINFKYKSHFLRGLPTGNSSL